MVAKQYDWLSGATLDEHSKRKHKILREYFFRYLNVRCQIPQQERFRLAIVDGFAGGGRYKCGTAGSPILFIEELKHALTAINLHRASQGMGTVEIECLLLFNDADPEVIELLKKKLRASSGGMLRKHTEATYPSSIFVRPIRGRLPQNKGLAKARAL